MKICVVGAGFSGSVVARQLAEHGHSITVVDERDHVGGNCHTGRDPRTGIMVHTYGPHIFHTDKQEVWDYINAFSDMMPFAHRVKAISKGQVYSLPINLLTINQFFGKTFSPTEAQSFIAGKGRRDIIDPKSFEEQALAMIGEELYHAFFYGYTLKQWGMSPAMLPASVLRRLPVRFNYDDNYFNHQYQGMPKDGYTPIFERLLDHRGIEVHLRQRHEDLSLADFEHTFFSGPLDRFFNYSLGPLRYRTLDFERFYGNGDFQGTAVLNYCDAEIPFTRITEHKHFAPWESASFDGTVCYREVSRECTSGDIPYYPIRQVAEKRLLSDYIALAKQTPRTSFIGRLGTYRYLDMDVSIGEALSAGKQTLQALQSGAAIPTFFIDPLS
ncbi:MAG TPA: UDP-galactopyranose mutase [Steroidobacteraceae bacterium]|nr:UDP-galactopyranose mutase [Steroidobacteraceae bacterium]